MNWRWEALELGSGGLLELVLNLPSAPCLWFSSGENTCLIRDLFYPPQIFPSLLPFKVYRGYRLARQGQGEPVIVCFLSDPIKGRLCSMGCSGSLCLSSLLASWSWVQDQLASSTGADGGRKSMASESWLCFSLVCVTSDHWASFVAFLTWM